MIPFNIYGIFQSGKSLLYDLIPSSYNKLPRELDIELYRRSDGLIDLYDERVYNVNLLRRAKWVT